MVVRLLLSLCAKGYGVGFKNAFLHHPHTPYHNNYRYYNHRKEKTSPFGLKNRDRFSMQR